MPNKLYKILLLVLAVSALSLVLPAASFAQYNVSGLVEFSYRDYKTKIGDTITRDSYWAQMYRANLDTDIWDPRFLRIGLGIGYQDINHRNGREEGYLDYDFRASFFPGRTIALDVFGRRSTGSVKSDSIIGRNDYDTVTTSYGGTVQLNLSRVNGNNGNANNNNNNNYANSRNGIVWPDIRLGRTHSELERLNTLYPAHEKRDNTDAWLMYRRGALFSITLNGSMESYENLTLGTAYETKTASMTSDAKVSADADLRLIGRTSTRTTENVSGFEPKEKSQEYDVLLNFKEKDRLQHYYKYNFTERQASLADYTAQRAEAQALYRILPELQLSVGMHVQTSDYQSNAVTPAMTLEQKSFDLLAGARYRRTYNPDFLGSFSFDTGYEFSWGVQQATSSTGVDGKGSYYTNDADLGLNSRGWKEETLGLRYNFRNKRDNSPVNNDTQNQSGNLFIQTKRIPKTSLNGSATYMVEESKIDIVNQFIATEAYSDQKRRSFTYAANADYAAMMYLAFNLGASRGQTASTIYSLSTLTVTATQYTTQDTLLFGGVTLNYPVSRQLFFNGTARKEYRRTQAISSEGYDVNMHLNYRIRMIFAKLEYQWKQFSHDYAPRTSLESYWLKISRPF